LSSSGLWRVCVISIFAALLGWTPVGQANDIYIAQGTVGSGTGASCANALAASFFNTSGNWTSATPSGSQIGPGSTVHICGTWNVTQGTTALTFQGSGASGNVITLLFETGAVLQSPAFGGSSHGANSGAIELNGKSHILINGGVACGKLNGGAGPTTACNGLIQNTQNGSPGLSCPAGACSDLNDNSRAIHNANSSINDIEIENLAIKNIYNRRNTSTADGAGTYEIYFDHTAPTNVRIHNCDIENGSENITIDFEGMSGDNLQIYDNNLTDSHWTIAIVGATSNTSYTNIQVYGNEISNWSNWSIPSSTYHTNGTQIFNGAGCSNCSIGGGSNPGSAIYANYMHGDLTGGQSSSSPTAILSLQDNTQGWTLYNNLIVDTCNGVGYGCGANMWFLGPNSQNITVYNNTIVNTAAGPVGIWAGSYSGTSNIVAKNNIFSNVAYPFYVNDSNWTELTTDYNDGYNTSSWICVNAGPGPPSCLTLTQYQSQHSGDSHGSTGNPNLDGNYKLQTGSAAIGLAANLTTLGITPLDSDLAGVARPSSGAWDAGAYRSGTGSATGPNPPQGLVAVVH
jgi:hypothetical protein